MINKGSIKPKGCDLRLIFAKQNLDREMASMKGMKRPGFLISWLLGAMSMFGISFVWHGVILNDLMAIPYPLSFFMGLCAIVYLFVSFLIAFSIEYLGIEEQHLPKGVGIGSILGFFLYLIAFTLGVSFQAQGTEHIVVNFLWQMIEQGVGGAMIGLVLLLDQRRAKVMGEESDQ